MSASAHSVALCGLTGVLVEVEAVVGGGTTKTVLVGLPDAALKESRDRVKAAVTACGYNWPSQQLTVNLSPAGVPKYGTHYDLAVAAAALAASEYVHAQQVRRFVFFGELGLDGRVRSVRGLLPALLAAANEGFERAIVPARQLAEASLVPGVQIWPVRRLTDMVEVLAGREVIFEPDPEPPQEEVQPRVDLADVQGNAEGKWALEVAAAGRHHLYLHGPPGVGKTMLVSRLPGILPDLVPAEAVQVSAIHSLAGRDIGGQLLVKPPYSDPHHNATMASLVGGGTGEIRPGAISLAHRGVLFLDEAPEFATRVLESLRTPLESGQVTIIRAHSQATFPARFQLVLAANPCPCGRGGLRGAHCQCTPMAVRRYAQRLSGPILDRIDIHQWLAPLSRALLAVETERGEPSAVVAQRVAEARQRQARRLKETGWLTNGEVTGRVLRKELPLPQGIELLERSVATGRLSPRGVDKVLKVAWTVADLHGHEKPNREDLAVALAMRHAEQAVAA